MAEYRKDKYYWFKMKEGFFKRHDIRIIKAMPNGKDYIIFYLQLLCESLSHDGHLRFSDTIPYDENMLSVITETNIDIVRSAMKLFVELDMIEILDDRTIYIKTLQNMVGSTTVGAEKKQLQLQNKKAKEKEKNLGGGLKVENLPPEIEKELEIEIEKELDIESVTDSPNPPPPPPKPKKHKHGEYKNVLLTDDELNKLQNEFGDLADKAITFLDEYIEMKGYKAKSHYLAIRKWVIDAVKERMKKKGNTSDYASYDLDAYERMLNSKDNPPPTAADNENIRVRAEALQKELAEKY